MDTVWFVRYRRGGGTDRPWNWETSAGLTEWADAPAPAQVGKRAVEGLLQRELPTSAARTTSNVTHWGYGLMWGGAYGLAVASRASGSTMKTVATGVFLGSVVWGSGYVVLPLMKLYRPIWEYDAKTLAKDWSAHVAYGVATALTWRLLAGSRTKR